MSGARDRAGEPADWSAEVAEIGRRREMAMAMGGPEKVDRQRASGRLTVRERIDRLADPGSFAEIGALTGFANYDDDGRLTSVVPANFVTGTARLDGRGVLLGCDDFTVRGGSGDAAIHAKQVFAEQYAASMRLPVVRLLDGASGGGSVKMTHAAGATYVPVNPAWDVVVGNLSLVPVVAACLGPTVGLGAARLVMSHLAIMVRGVGQLFTAGPPVVRAGTGEDLTKEELGGAAVHLGNGTIERFADSEEEAFGIIRAFLSYLPASVHELPPVRACDDPPDRREEALISAIPRNPRLPYRIEPILVYGVAGAGAVNRHRAARSWAWPSGDCGSLPVQGGVEAAFRGQIEQAEDRDAEIERIRATLAAISSPFRTAERFGVQDLIDPRDTRPLLCEWVRDAYRVMPEVIGPPSFGTRP